MSATEDWLRYIESKAIKQIYNINGYTEQEDGSESSEQSSTDCTN